MLRKRSLLILTIRAFSKVSFSPLLFRSSIKTSPIIHHYSSRRFETAARTSDSLLDPNGSYPQNPLGSDSLISRDLRQSPCGVYDSGQNPNGLSEKSGDFCRSSDFDHVSQLNSGRCLGGNLDGYQRRNVGDVSQLNPNGFFREYSNLHQRENIGEVGGSNLNMHQRNNFRDVNQWDPNGFPAENPHGAQRNNVEENRQLSSSGFSGDDRDRYVMSTLGGVQRLSSNEFNVETASVHQRNDLWEHQSNLNGSYGRNLDRHQGSNFRRVQQLNSHGPFRDYTNQDTEVSFKKESSKIGEVDANSYYQDPGAFYTEKHRNSSESYQNFSAGYDRCVAGESSLSASGIYRGNPNDLNRENPYQRTANVIQRSNYDGFYMQSPRSPGELPQNSSGQAFQKNPNTLFGYNKVDKVDLEAFQRNPNGHLGSNHGKADQNFYGYNRESPLPAGQHSQFPLVDGSKVNNELTIDKLHETDENISYKGTLIELDECCEKDKVKEAVEVLALLRKNGVVVDVPRYLKLLQACGEAKSLEEARIIHSHIYEAMGEVGVVVNNKILDVYSRCGSMTDAYQMFEKMPQRNLTSWDTMISGLANNNLGEEAIDLFTQFKEIGLQPDGGLYIAVFNACGVIGAVDEGMLHFESMKVDFSIAATMEHYVSIVDMLGRSGYLDEALDFIEKMPVEPSVDVWETLMNLCRVNGYMELGNRCAEIVEQLDSSRLTELTKVGLLPVIASDNKKAREDKSNHLDFARQRLELKAGDRSHPEHERIYKQLRALVPNMKDAGYVPNTRLVLHDIDQEAREEAVLAHSEKLAAAYVLMTSPARSTIRIMKNLRFCTDCHEAMKIISKLTGRYIICRDAKRFHHFENGFCSCKDFY